VGSTEQSFESHLVVVYPQLQHFLNVSTEKLLNFLLPEKFADSSKISQKYRANFFFLKKKLLAKYSEVLNVQNGEEA